MMCFMEIENMGIEQLRYLIDFGSGYIDCYFGSLDFCHRLFLFVLCIFELKMDLKNHL
jgi:hypothetical protein